MLKYRNGFSLIELLITLTIVTIVTAFSLSSINYFWQKSTATALKNTLLHAIMITKRNAFILGAHASLCASSDARTCGDRWQDGFIVLANDKLIFATQNFSASGMLHWRSFPQGQMQVDFGPMLQPTWQNGTFWYCAKNSDYPLWALSLSRFGNVHALQADQKGKILDELGRELIC